MSLSDILLYPLFKTTNERIADLPFLQFGVHAPGVYRLSLLGLINSVRILLGFRPWSVTRG